MVTFEEPVHSAVGAHECRPRQTHTRLPSGCTEMIYRHILDSATPALGLVAALTVLLGYPMATAAQDDLTVPEGYEAVGDWFVQEDTDPFDDSVTNNLMLLAPSLEKSRGITAVAIRCAAGPG